ncbi:S-layer family protein [Burkholderia ambifaria]|uniref:beta strand repeat-containing protein n=1 Tax=Burkholderia ambifaria TaxID=152480 RepID=UPI001BA1436B|nr:S-layer family protein [Burkholderia ambifaria]MBR8182511.1 S-layer family protein [Burkholderia ambifaria]
MGTVTTAQGAAALTNFLVGGATSFGDAANATSQALSATNTPDRVINAVGATADVAGVGATGVQIIQQFASNSTEAGILAGATASVSAQLTVAANSASILKTLLQNGYQNITASQIDALAGSMLASGSLIAEPQTAIILGALSAGMIAFGWSKQANNTTIGDVLSEIKNIAQSYYSKLSDEDQAAFANNLSSSIQSVLSGGMLVPQISTSGQISGYEVDIPTSVIPQSDGSTLYTFSSGVTFSQAGSKQIGPLQESANTGENVWTIPQSATNSVKLDLFSDGSYSNSFADSTTNTDVAEVYIAGPAGNYSVSGSGGATFIRDVGNGNNVNVAPSSFIGIQGNNDTANASSSTVQVASNVSANVVGGGNGVTENAGDSIGAYGGGNTIYAAANSWTALGNTNGALDLVYANGLQFGGTTANGQGTGIWLGTNTQANVNGSNNGINESAGDSMGAYGGGNTIYAAASSWTALGNTNGALDLVYANGLQFGGTTANGQGTGIWLGTNTQANVNGSNNGINESAGDSMGAYGGGNTIYTAANSWTALGNTTGALDLVYANGLQFGGTTANGQGTGIWLGTNTQANVNGSNNGINESAGDSMGAYGGGNTIYTAANSWTALGNTNGALDLVYANGLQFGGTTANGQGTGIWLGTDTQANVNGSNNGINENAGDSMGAYGGGNTINAVAGSMTALGNTNWVFDTINANGVLFGSTTANGQGSGIWLSGNTQVNVYGNNNGVNVGVGDNLGVYGAGNRAIVTGANSEVWIGGNGQAATVAQDDRVDFAGGVTGTVKEVDNSRVDINGSGLTVSAGYQDLLGVAGNANTIVAGAGDALALDGQQNKVTMAHGNLHAGDNNQFTLSGSFNDVTAGNGVVAALWGDDNIINAGNNAVVNSSGIGNEIYAGSGSVVGVTGGDASVETSNITVYVADNSNVEVWGSNDVIYSGVNSRVVIVGNGNTVKGAQGASVGITGNSNAVSIGDQGTIFVEGSNNSMVTGSASKVNIADSSYTGNVVNGGSGTTVQTGVGSISFPSQNLPDTSLPASKQIITNPYANIPYVFVNTSLPPVNFWSDVGNTTTAGSPIYYPWIPSEEDPTVGVPIPVTAPPCSNGVDPIILNLNGDAVQTTSLASSSTHFDMLNDGRKVQTAWGTAGEGYLVYDPSDPNSATAVTQDNQLVGGFGALQSLAQQVDGVGHGTLTASDALWNSLKVWVDTTGTGQFQRGQLMSLDQLGITSLNLDGEQVNRDSNGNQILVDSSFTRADGSTGDVAGVSLMNNPNATANPVENQVRSLIAAMASFAPSAGSSAVPQPVHQDAFAALAANLH